jgi:hypothetical protein
MGCIFISSLFFCLLLVFVHVCHVPVLSLQLAFWLLSCKLLLLMLYQNINNNELLSLKMLLALYSKCYWARVSSLIDSVCHLSVPPCSLVQYHKPFNELLVNPGAS